VLVVLGLLAAPGPQSRASRSVHALFFGDSLFAGNGAVPLSPVQVRTANTLLGWRGALDTVGGTGYTTGGDHRKPFLQRFQRDGYLRTPYDVIVIEGGTNDAHHGDVSTLHDKALELLDYVHERQPKARIILVGGFAPRGVPNARYAEMDRVLSGVAAERGLTYISQQHYATEAGRGFYSADDLHPTAIGYRQMGRDLAKELRAALG
jgi:lysophospholipase L1-like esterase